MTDVILYGELAQEFKPRWQFEVRSVSEALRALEANTNRLYKFLCLSENAYHIKVNDKDVTDLNELSEVGTLKKIEISPVIKGSGSSSGAWLIVVGIILVAIAVVVTLPAGGEGGFATAGAFLQALGQGFTGVLTTIGLSLVIGGIAQLVVPSPDTKGNEKPENKPSYLYTGPVNTYRQGNCVPVLYGELRVGSQVISAGVSTLDISPTY